MVKRTDIAYTAIEKEPNDESIKLLKELYTIMDIKMQPIKLLNENEKQSLIKILELIQ